MEAVRAPMHIGIIGLTAVGFEFADHVVDLGHTISGADAKVAARSQFESDFDATSYETPAELLAQDIDAIVVSAPNKFHERPTVEALEQNIPVLVEKPLAHTLESAQRIRDAARNASGFGMVTFNHKFLNRSQLLKSYVDQGYFGDISHIHARHISRRDIPSRGSWMTSKDIAGGGALFDRGTFVIDFILYLMDYARPIDITGGTWRDFDSLEDYAYLQMYGEDETGDISDVDDSAFALLRFPNGCSVSIEIAWAANVGTDRQHTYEIRGKQAGAMLDISNADHPDNVLQFYEVRSGVVDHFFDVDVRSAHTPSKPKLIQTFLAHVADGSKPEMNTIEQAYIVQEIIEDIYDVTNS